MPTNPLPSPQNPTFPDPNSIITGCYTPPIDRIRIFSASQWEDFILEWADSLRDKYIKVERCAGAGDMGRDIIAFAQPQNGKEIWDNYQCKKYDHPLRPSDIWVEIGKLVYYTYIGEFSYPRKYFFVSPLGVGTTLINLFHRPEKLRSGLIENWNIHCKEKITLTKSIELDKNLQQYIEKIDFAIIGYINHLNLIKQHASTPYHISRFGGGLPNRPSVSLPPTAPTKVEVTYISKLMEAYEDHLNRQIVKLEDLENEPDLKAHYTDSRIQFYSAESLRSFSRDYLPPGEFQKLQDEIYDGIRDDIRDEYSSGYRRILAVVKTARLLPLSSHALVCRLTSNDRSGICHQLANDKDEVRWVQK